MKVLFIDSTHPLLVANLEAAGIQCDYQPKITYDEFISILPQYEALVLRSKFKLGQFELQHGTKLKAIGRVGAGLENIDTDFATQQGINCINVPEGNRDAVGEQALGMLLMLLNNLYRAHTEVCNGVWEREGNRGVEIKGKCIGIIGYGNMGQAFAQRLAGFEAKVLAYDKYKVAYGNPFAQEATLDDIFEQADILSIHLPLTPETLYMVDADFIQKFKKNIYFINTSRGKNLKTADLVSALKSGKVLGAALDVLEYESISFENLHKAQLPPDFEYLTQSTNVVLSPHIAGWTHESNTKLAYYTALKIIRTLQA